MDRVGRWATVHGVAEESDNLANKQQGCTENSVFKWKMDLDSSLNEVNVARLCLTLCDPTDYTRHGILQARILEWAAFPFSGGSFQPRD